MVTLVLRTLLMSKLRLIFELIMNIHANPIIKCVFKYFACQGFKHLENRRADYYVQTVEDS